MKIIYEIMQIIKNIKKIISWIPVLWNDRNFDEVFMLKILHKKLEGMEEFFRSDRTWSANSDETAHEIMTAKNLCKRLISKNYLNDSILQHHKLNFWEFLKKIENGKSFNFGDIDKKQDYELKKSFKHADYMEKQDWNYLWDLIKKYGRMWWD
jgi:hypothetical protein